MEKTMAEGKDGLSPNERTLESVLRMFSLGLIDRAKAQEETGLSYGEILVKLGEFKLSRPVVRTFNRFNEKQKALYREIFAKE
jgi:hypothetical protein